MTKEGKSQGWIEPEVLTASKEINPESAKRNTVKLLKGLSELGLLITDLGEPTIVNIPPIEIKQKANYALARLEEQTFTTDIPNPDGGFSREELIRDTTEDYLFSSAYFLGANMLFTDQPFKLYLSIKPESVLPYHLSLLMPTALQARKEMLLRYLPPNFSSVVFEYDLASKPQLKRRLSELAQRRIPAEAIDNDLLHKSFVEGKDTPEGTNTAIRLYLQDPNPQSFLECYEVERFPQGNKGKDDTEEYVNELVSEANWQENEFHNCLIPRESDKTYPLIPSTNLDKISKLRMIVSYRGDTPQVMSDLLGYLPLSIDWTNQWYASQSDHSENGYMQLLFKPKWGDENAAFVYHKSSKERISPEDIHNALKEMNTVRNNLTERLT